MTLMMTSGDDELVSSLLFDAEATRGVVSDWRKENSDAALNHSPKNKSVKRCAASNLAFHVLSAHSRQ